MSEPSVQCSFITPHCPDSLISSNFTITYIIPFTNKPLFSEVMSSKENVLDHLPQLGKNMLLGQPWNYQAESVCAEIKIYPKISELAHSDKSPKPEKLGKLRPMEGKLYIITLLVNVSSKSKVS